MVVSAGPAPVPVSPAPAPGPPLGPGGRATPAAWTGGLVPLAPRADPELFAEWTSLATRAGVPPFLEPAFFALERPLIGPGLPLLAIARRADPGSPALAGVLPLVRRGSVLEALRSDHAPAFDYVGDRAALAGIWQALAADPTWSTLVLRGVPAGSLLTSSLPGLALRDLCLTAVRPSSRSPYLALPDFESHLSSKHRQNLRRCRRKLGEVELERITRFSRPDLDQALAIEALAWKGDAGTSIAGSPRLIHFYTALARWAARRSQLALWFLRAGQRRIAFALTLEHDRTVYALKVGYDPALSDVSPGHLLFAELARDAEKRGLLELDFLGRDDEWKRRWTNRTHDHVSMVIYRPSIRGTAELVAREILEPRLPDRWLELVDSAAHELRRRSRRCQHDDLIGCYLPGQRAFGRLRAGLGVRSGLKRIVQGPADQPRQLGTPSRYGAGQWVRVLPEADLPAHLDGHDRLGGLKFVEAQWTTAGQSFRVDRPVRRLVDDRGQMRAVSRTVLLEGVTCDVAGPELGCGRHCPLMFRDDWLEPAEDPGLAGPHPRPSAAGDARSTHARVRTVAEIRATLDRRGRRDGVSFMPEMERFAGQQLPVVRRLSRVFELDAWRVPRAPIFMLAGAHCTGAVLGSDGPCDRACTLLWHRDWLIVAEAEAPAGP